MRHIEFVTPTENAYVNALADALKTGARHVDFPVVNRLARAVAMGLTAAVPGADIELGPAACPAARRTREPAPVVVLCETDGERLTAALMEYIDRPDVTVIAPITESYWNRRPLFLISIPKAGTHLLGELATAFGYADGGECHPHALAGAWHFVEFTNFHTAAPDFFIDSVRRAPHGNRTHPYAYHPALFNYRNPLDIVASEANYYHEDGATTFSGYLSALSYEERLLRLIDDPWLLGSVRDRVGKFAAWLDFPNVLPVSYEELVGAQGGGSDIAQLDLIWSLMLRLHVPGRPSDIAAQVFNPDSATFRSGKIGSHARRFTPAAWEKFRALPQDFMQVYGYGEPPAEGPWLSSRSAEFRRRVPRYSKADVSRTAFVVQTDFLGKKIVQYRGQFWAIPAGASITDEAIAAAARENLTAPDIDILKFVIQSKMFLEFTQNSPATSAPTGIVSLVARRRGVRT